MEKLFIEIREIDNGWILTIEGDTTINVKDLYRETFKEILEYLDKLNFGGK